jgi:hypothetical protein
MGNRPMVRENMLSYPLFHGLFYLGSASHCVLCIC